MKATNLPCMRIAIQTNRFKKDLRRCVSRNFKLSKLEMVFEALRADETLPASYRPHKLQGEYKGKWECHVDPDWLLIYDYPDGDTLVLYRTGTHSDLFN